MTQDQDSPLERAARRVALRLPCLVGSETDMEGNRARRRLATIVFSLHDPVGDGGDASALPIPPPPLDRVILTALRDELLELPSTPRDADEILRAARACARYLSTGSEALSPEDPAPTPTASGPVSAEHEELDAAMSGPDAFELLVEVAHDFRSPLTSILFLSETLRDGNSGPVNDHQRSQLGLIYSAAFGLASVASDVVDLAREGRGLVGEDKHPYAFAEVFRRVERVVCPLVEEKGLELRVKIPEHGSSEGHPHAISRVLLNLTTNALKFTDDGFVELGVEPLPHGKLRYYVQDTGRGIPPDRQEELFRPFKRRTDDPEAGHFFSGSGIGLSIARRLVEAMGSTLEFRTSDEEGTRFHFDLRSPARR